MEQPCRYVGLWLKLCFIDKVSTRGSSMTTLMDIHAIVKQRASVYNEAQTLNNKCMHGTRILHIG